MNLTRKKKANSFVPLLIGLESEEAFCVCVCFSFILAFYFVNFLVHILIEKILIRQTLNYGRFVELVLQTKNDSAVAPVLYEFDAMRSNDV